MAYRLTTPHGGRGGLLGTDDTADSGERVMGLPASEQFVLDLIENQLRTTDPEVSAPFDAFTSITSQARMPFTERLSARHPLQAVPASRPPGRTDSAFGLMLAMTFMVWALLTVSMVLVFMSAG